MTVKIHSGDNNQVQLKFDKKCTREGNLKRKQDGEGEKPSEGRREREGSREKGDTLNH